MQLVEQVCPFSICSGRLGEMLMMQCADPNTLPAPSRLHQLEQSLSLSLSPSASFVNPYLTFLFISFFFVFLKKAQLYFFFLIVLLLPFSLAAVHHVHHDCTHKPSVSSCCLHFWTYPSCSLIWTNKKSLFSEKICQWGSQESKSKDAQSCSAKVPDT